MQQATIVCKYVNQPKPGGKFASIKDQTNNVWWAEPHVFAAVQVGQQITIEYADQQWGRGATARTVQVVNRVLDEAPRTQGTQAPQIIADKDCRIFVCGFLQSLYHGTGTYPGADALMEIIYATRCAYETAFAKPLKVPQGIPGTRPLPARQNNYESYDPRDDQEIPL